MKQIHLIAPSGASLDARSPEAGISWLGQQGIEVLNADCVVRVEQRFAGTDAQRLAEINQLAFFVRVIIRSPNLDCSCNARCDRRAFII